MIVDRILVAVDGSQNGRDAVAWAAQLADQLDAEVVAVHALGLLHHAGDHTLDAALPRREEIRQRFEHEWCRPLDALRVRSRRILADGPPAAVIARVADDEDVDLVVVGCRGHTAVPSHLLGSTSSSVAQGSSRPVVIVPPGLAIRPSGHDEVVR